MSRTPRRFLAPLCTVRCALSAGGHQRRALCAAATAAALFALPASATAGTVSFDNGRLTFGAGPGETNNVTVAASGDSATVTDTGAALTAGTGCQGQPGGSVVCPGGPNTVLLADLGDGDDGLAVSGALPAQVTAGPGNDRVTGGSADDVLRGDAGDNTLDGGDGNDSLIAAAGKDSLVGGTGDDSLQSGDGDDTLSGGDGNDTLTAKDGADGLDGGNGNDRLEAGKGSDSLDAGAGDDVLLTAEGEFKGTHEKRIRCGAGSDRLTAGPADPFVSDCEQIDGASLRLRRGGAIPLVLVCVQACNGSVRIRDAKNKINASAPLKLGAGKSAVIQVRLTAAEVARLFRKKKARLTARFNLTAGGSPQRLRATFTLLRRV